MYRTILKDFKGSLTTKDFNMVVKSTGVKSILFNDNHHAIFSQQGCYTLKLDSEINQVM